MIIRVRSPSGTSRVELPDASNIFDLKKKVGETVQLSPSQVVLSTDSSGANLLRDDQKSLAAYGLKHGDMIFLISGPTTTTTTTTTTTSSITSPKITSYSSNNNNNDNNNNNNNNNHSTPNGTPNGTPHTSRCTHRPNTTCVFCTPSASGTPEETKKKCDHSPFVSCLSCSKEESKKSKKINWLCTHPPGAKCVNCMRIPRKGVSYKCTHPSYVKCPNCSDETASNGESSTTTPSSSSSSSPSTRCLHGKNAACANCLPKEEETDTPTKRKCRNHGPHGSCVECIEWLDSQKMKLKPQPQPHCTTVVVDFKAAAVFQNYLHEKRFKVNRCGILYGRINDDASVSVDVIYEPPQQTTPTSVLMMNDVNHDKVEQLAGMLGLTRVGWILSHPPRAKGFILSGDEVATAAQFQNLYGNHFVTLILTLSEKGEGTLEAFQVSDQAMKLHRTGQFTDPINDSNPSINNGTLTAKTFSISPKAHFKEPVIVEQSETREADTAFFVVNLPVKSNNGSTPLLFCSGFPVENREHAQAPSDLKVHLINNTGKPFLQNISDFHFLLYLSNSGYFDWKSDIPILCEAVRTKNDETLKNYKEIIEHLAQI